MSAETAWGVDSEYGRLLDVLLCPPGPLPLAARPARSRAPRSASDLVFSPTRRSRQHAEMVSVYEEAGVNVHFLEPDPHLPYQVFARDSSINVPDGPIVTQCAQWWRRGEYAPVIRFYQEHDIPIAQHGHRRLARGRRLHDRRARRGRDRHRRGAHPGAGRAPGGRLARGATAGRCASSASRRTSSTSTCSPACSARSSPPSASSRPPTASCSWLESKDVEIVPVTLAAALKLGVNGVCLGGDRILSTAESKDLNERLRALGLTVYDPELSSFTLGGGGAHCLMQAIRRERVAAALALGDHPQRAQRAVARAAQRRRRGRAPAGCSRASRP